MELFWRRYLEEPSCGEVGLASWRKRPGLPPALSFCRLRGPLPPPAARQRLLGALDPAPPETLCAEISLPRASLCPAPRVFRGAVSGIRHSVRIEQVCRVQVEPNGRGAHPLFAFLRKAFGMKAVPWNFQKFLVDRDGHPLAQYAPQVDPPPPTPPPPVLSGHVSSFPPY